MKNIWMLAQKDGDAPPSLSSEPVTTEDQPSVIVPDKSGGGDPNSAGAQPARRGFGNMQYILLALMFVMMYFILFRGPRKKQQQHKQMVQTLTKNDKVRTIGGIIGTVVDVKGDEIVLKIDESNNTKIRLSASAIGRNLSKDNS